MADRRRYVLCEVLCIVKQAKVITLFPFCSFNPNAQLSKLCTELWELDEQRLVIGKDVVIDLQGRMSDYKNNVIYIHVEILTIGKRLFCALYFYWQVHGPVIGETKQQIHCSLLWIQLVLQDQLLSYSLLCLITMKQAQVTDK